jgi:hypothetical protein
MEGWIDRLAETLGEDALSGPETARLLGVARDVAHRVERKVTPLAAFVIGCAVGRSLAGGASREQAMTAALETVDALLPDAPAEVPPESG